MNYQIKLQNLVSKLAEIDQPHVKEYNAVVRDEHVVVKRYPSVTDNPEFFRARDEQRKGVKLYRWNTFG